MMEGWLDRYRWMRQGKQIGEEEGTLHVLCNSLSKTLTFISLSLSKDFKYRLIKPGGTARHGSGLRRARRRISVLIKYGIAAQY